MIKILTDSNYRRAIEEAKHEAVDKWREQRDIERRFIEMEERMTRIYQQLEEIRAKIRSTEELREKR